MKTRYFLEIAYKGDNFHGWQIQPQLKTVQQVLNEHLSVLLGEKINCIGCGRTDAGVHARSYLCHFDVEKPLPENFHHEINSFLPKDILIKNIFLNKSRIHARWDALSRSYEYLICKGKNPFYNDFAAIEYNILNVELMNQACNVLMKYEDFSTFSKAHGGSQHNLCRIFEAKWTETDEFYKFQITANRFTRGMVRLICGTMVLVGKQKLTPEDFEKAILAKNRNLAGKSMPACGLYFTGAKYKDGFLILKSYG